MSLQDDIQALSENGWQALDDSTRSRLKASIDIPTIQEISDNGWQGIGDSTKAVLREKWSAPAQAEPVAPVAPKAAPGWGEVFFPTLSPVLRKQGMSILSQSPSSAPAGLDAVTGAASRGADVREQIWPLVRDMLTMPLRAAAGGSAAIGQTIGGAEGVGGLLQGVGLRRPDVEMAYKTTMADPQAEAVAMDANVPVGLRYSANPSLFSGIANDPTTLPLIAAGKLPIGGLAQGLLSGTTTLGARSLDRGELSPSAFDAIPLLLGGVGPLGGAMMRGGNKWFREMVKPASVKGGKELAGLNTALEGGLLPKLAGWKLTVGGAGERFLRNLGKEGEQIEPILAEADATGMKVSPAQAMAEADAAMRAAIKSEAIGSTIDEAKAGLDWVRARAHKPTGENVDAAWAGYGAPANDVLPSIAHARKSNLYDAAYDVAPAKNDIAPLAAKLYAIKEVARSFRRQLAEISPEYARKMEDLAPLYGAEDAMTRAASRGGNKFSMNPVNIALGTPALPRAMWETGRILSSAAPGTASTAGGLLDGIILRAIQGSPGATGTANSFGQ